MMQLQKFRIIKSLMVQRMIRRNSQRKLALGMFAAFAVGLIGAPVMPAGTLTWDPSANHSGSDGSGSWDSTSLNWATGASDSAWVSGDIAAIGSSQTAGTITLGANITAGGLIFNPVATGSTYTLAASGSYGLTLNNGGSGGTVDISLNADATITAPILFNSNFQLSGTGNHTLTLSGSGGVTFGSGLTVTIGSGSMANASTLLATSTGGGGGAKPNLVFDGGTFQSFDIGHSGELLTSQGGTGIFNTFDANNNLTSGVESSITQSVAGTTFVLQDGTINLVADNNSTFTAGTLQIGSASSSNPTNVVFGYQVSSTNDSNLPTANVTINLDYGTLTQASSNVIINSNTYTVDTAPSTIANNITLSGTGDAINPGSLANMRLRISGVISGGSGSPLAFNSDGSTSGVELSGNNTYQGGTTINAGNVRVDTSSALGTGTVTLNPTIFSSIQFGASGLSIANSLVLQSANEMNLEMHGNSGTWSGAISGTGAGGLTVTDFKNLNSQLTLSSTNTYTGHTIIGDNTNAVSLNLTGSLANTNITISSHASLTGSGTLNWNLTNDAGDLITADGGLTISGLHLDVHVTGTQTQPQYVVANYTSGTLIGSSFASVAGLPTGWSINYGVLHPNEIVLLSTITIPTLTWAPGGTTDGAGNWDTTTTNNWSPGGVAWTNGDIAVIGGGGTGNTITVAAPVTAGGLTFKGLTGGQYTIAGTSALTLANSGGVAVVMNNSATINAPIAFNNSVTVSGTGVLSFAGGNVTFGSGAGVQIGTGSATQIPTVLVGAASGSGGGSGPSQVVFDGGIFENTKSGNSDSTSYYSIDSGTATVNTFDAGGTNQTLDGAIYQTSADTFVLRNGAINLGGSIASTFTAGNLQIGVGSSALGATVTFGYNGSNNLPASNVPIIMNYGGLTQASANNPNGNNGSGDTVDTVGNTIANPIHLIGSGTYSGGQINAGTASNMSLTLSGIISGSSGVDFNGDGSTNTITLSGTNTYTGGTTIGGGTVVAGTSSAFGTGVLQVNTGATLETQNVVSNTGSAITIHGTRYTQQTGATLALFGRSTGSYDTVQLGSGTASLNGTLDMIFSGFTPASGQTYDVIGTSGSVSGNFALVSLFGATGLVGTTSFHSGTGELLTLSTAPVAPTLTWAPGGTTDGAGNWDTTTSNNWSPGGVAWTNGDIAAIGGGGAGNTITVAAPVTAAGLTFNVLTSGQYIIAGTSTLTLTAAGGVAVVMNSSATINAPVSFNNSVTISGTGILSFAGNNVTFGSGAGVQIGTGSTTQIPTVLIGSAGGGGGGSGPSQVVFDGGIFENTKSGNSDSTPYYSIDSGTATVNTFDAGGTNQTLDGAINQTGNDTFVLRNGTINLGGSIAGTFTAGHLQIGNGSAGTLVIFGYNNSNNLPASGVPIVLDSGTLTQASANNPNGNNGSGDVVDTSPNTIANNITLAGTGDAINPGSLANMRLKITGVISGGSGSPLAFNSDGSTSGVELSGNNTYQGGTNINSGNVRVDVNSAFGTGAVTLNPTTFASIQYGVAGLTLGNSLVLDSANEMNLEMHGNSGTWSGVISGTGTGGLTVTDFKNLNSQLTLSNVNTYTGPTIVGDNTNQVALNLTGSLANSNITIESHAGLGGSGTLNWNLLGDTGDLITAGGGFTISGLHLKLDLSGTHTQSRYVIANYTGGTLNGTQFASVANLPTGWSVNYGSVDPNNIVLLMPVIGWSPSGSGDGSGNWDTSSTSWGTGSSYTTWTNGTVATIGHGGTAGVITIASTGVSVTGITFNPVSATSPGQYTIAGSSTNNLTLTGSGTMAMNADATISAPMVGTGSLTVTGAHNLTISGVSSYTGATSVNSGILTLVTGAAITSTTALTIAPGAAVAINSTGASDGITINYTAGNSPNATIRNEIITGYNTKAWNGTSATGGAINSATAAANNQKYAVAYADGADGVVTGLGSTQEKVMLTLAGDATLAGSVRLIDFTILMNHYGVTSGAQWDQGDFNYDGKVNLSDFTLFMNNYGQSLSPGVLADVPMVGNRSQATPEPQALIFVLMGGMSLLLLNRRRLLGRSICRT